MALIENQTKVKVFTLIFVKRDNFILLGLKKRGFGSGKWNGFGGKVDADETTARGAVRELEEESGIRVRESDLTDLGYLVYVDSDVIRVVRVFSLIRELPVTFSESEEMLPKWFDVADIPYSDMWPDSEHWLPHVLSDTKFWACFVYGKDGEIVYKLVDKI